MPDERPQPYKIYTRGTVLVVECVGKKREVECRGMTMPDAVDKAVELSREFGNAAIIKEFIARCPVPL